MESPAVTRFAPSPTGLIHFGNVRTALFNVLWARKTHGRFLLRIEDTDRARSEERYVEALMEDLRWLGLDWDAGPDSAGESYYQSQRGAVYDRYFAALETKGLVYPCFCTEQELKLARKTQLAAGRTPRYSGRCRTLSAADVAVRRASGAASSLRFRVPAGAVVTFDDVVRGPQRFATDDIGDFVIRRSDGTPAFFFSNAIDDATMQVTLVLRGEDHLSNTPRQMLLLEALGLPVPRYGHISLIVGADGAPLSKRHGSRTVRELRDAGYFPIAINNYLARLGHAFEDNALLSLDALAQGFELARLGRAPARYDADQLLHWQREAIRQVDTDTLWAWMGAATQALVPPAARDGFIDAVRANVGTPEQAAFWARVVFTDDWPLSHAARETLTQAGAPFFTEAAASLADGADFKALSQALQAKTGRKGKALFQPLRAALTGELDGPEMARLLPLITLPRARSRLAAAAHIAGK